MEVVAEGEPAVLTISEQETKKEEAKVDVENVEEKGLQVEQTNFYHGLQLIKEWIANPKHGKDYKENTTTWNNTKGHWSMPPLLNNIIKEIIDEESKFLEPDEQQDEKKRNPEYKVWSKMKK